MVKRESISLLVFMFLGILVIVAILIFYAKWPAIKVPYPAEEKTRFLNYLRCAMAMCSGEDTRNVQPKDVCLSPEVIGVGIIDKDSSGNYLLCSDLCRNLSGNEPKERMCGKDYTIEFTFKETVTITQKEVIRNLFGHVMHWCCNYEEEGLHWFFIIPRWWYRGTGGKLYLPKDYDRTEWEKYQRCTFRENSKVKFYAFQDENINSVFDIFGEICTKRFTLRHVCSSINITEVS